jgi:uncharacterized membrane protein
MIRTLVAGGATALAFLALDAVWLSQMGPRLYRPVIGEMMAAQVRLVPAVAFYLIYVAGLVFFAVQPGLDSGRWTKALVNGAILGFVAYATYDLTNQATLKTWSTTLTLADLAWGAFASGVACAVGWWAGNRFGS